jgi:hypothetical protein
MEVFLLGHPVMVADHPACLQVLVQVHPVLFLALGLVLYPAQVLPGVSQVMFLRLELYPGPLVLAHRRLLSQQFRPEPLPQQLPAHAWQLKP